MISRFKTWSGLLVVVACLAAAGCGGSVERVTVTGKIVDGGAPLKLAGTEQPGAPSPVEIRFCPVDEALTKVISGMPISLSASPKQDGSFVIDGGDGKGIPVGRYKVTMSNRNMMMDRRSAPKSGAQGDVWEGRFSIENTPFSFDIQAPQEIVLDIAKTAAAPEAKP